ncbi:phosphatase PAP2 family protein [Promicromonospora iranensis]|uniref:Undecaprenyl-diphosphatase n=1 Tax=Promicromonospora iranensis TaxID=1105144 RepID=A0ABU2CHW2_9MICO|nr:phosphatase PAP2 family protein [Promicromonospora iranensis]MDR7380792.1 undecaprenyl-diphosphatase [Promicromonospora iranensis]
MSHESDGRAGEAPPPGAGRFTELATLGLVALVLGAVPFLGLLALLKSEWAPLARLDQGIADTLNSAVATRPLAVRILEILSEAGGGATAGYIVGLTAVALLVRGRRRLATYAAVTGAGLLVLVPVSKALVGRTRPEVALPVVELPTNASFPSGHAMTSFATWGLLALIALPHTRGAIRWAVVGSAAAIIILVGFTRLALGVHFLSDVLAGWALAGAWLAVTTAGFRTWQWPGERPPDAPGATPHREPGSRRAGLSAALAPSGQPVWPRGRRSVGLLTRDFVVVLIIIASLGLLVTGPLAATALGSWDQYVADRLVDTRTPPLTEVALRVNVLAGLWGIVVVITAQAALALAWTGSWRPVVFALLAIVGELALYLGSAAIVARARPDVPDLTHSLPTGASWPSGHLAAAVVTYGGAALLLLMVTRRWWRWVGVAVMVAVVVGTAWARLYTAAHYPTDVAVGILLGVLWLTALHRHLLDGAWVIPRRRDVDDSPLATPHRRRDNGDERSRPRKAAP